MRLVREDISIPFDLRKFAVGGCWHYARKGASSGSTPTPNDFARPRATRVKTFLAIIGFSYRYQLPLIVSSTFIAALWPGIPLTAPPRKALDPQRNTFS